ncbi:TMEM175 family protein [Streptomyces sp. 4N509B]|uniref:TMEM175 family protein n=1 Tax=Streptomyces sp. 4N509B TaxID=3457413 RepID=UPI003FD661C0
MGAETDRPTGPPSPPSRPSPRGAQGATGPGEGVERLTALSDGVFAIAMTLLALDIRVPPGLDDGEFHEALWEALPNVGAYALSFTVIAQFWRNHRLILGGGSFAANGHVVRWTLLGLALVALLPFPTSLLAEYDDQAVAVAVYGGCVAAINAAHLFLLLTTNRLRPPPRDRLVARARRLDAADLGVVVVVFGASTPLAALSPALAMWSWLTLVPLKTVIGRRQRRLLEQGAYDTV